MKGFFKLLTSVLFFVSFMVIITVASCSNQSEENKYIGKWKCSRGGSEFFEIKDNNGSLLVTDTVGDSVVGNIDDKGVLILSGVPSVGQLPLPIDSQSGELLCSMCGCRRFTKENK